MKNFILGIIIVLSTTMVYGQSESKSEAIDVLLNEIQVKEVSEQMMLGLIKSFLKKKPNAPKSLELEINKLLDYDDYVLKIKDAYTKTYTKAEIVELTRLHQSGNKELYKQKSEAVAKVMYEIGSTFGRESVKIITTKLQAY